LLKHIDCSHCSVLIKMFAAPWPDLTPEKSVNRGLVVFDAICGRVENVPSFKIGFTIDVEGISGFLTLGSAKLFDAVNGIGHQPQNISGLKRLLICGLKLGIVWPTAVILSVPKLISLVPAGYVSDNGDDAPGRVVVDGGCYPW
jgi:hypothetical protein